MNIPTKPRIGLLRFGSRRFRQLGEGTPSGTYEDRINREGQQLSAALADHADLVDPGVLFAYQDVVEADRVFVHKQVDCVLAVFHSWAEDNVWIRFLRDYRRDDPLIYFYPAKEDIPFESCGTDEDFTQFLASGGLVGMLVGSGSIKKHGGSAWTVAGTIADRSKDIITYARTALVRSNLRNARFGVLPSFNEIMWNTYVDPYSYHTVGPELTFISYEELKATSDRLSSDAVEQWRKELIDVYRVDDDIDDEKFSASVRYSLGLAALADQYSLNGLTLNDVDMRLFELIGLRPGFYPTWFSKHQAVLCPEGDAGLLLAHYILKQFSKAQVNTIEPFYIDDSRKLFCAGHAGPNDYTASDSEAHVRIAVDARFARTQYRYAGAPFAWLRIPPGEMTMLHMSCHGDSFIMVGTLVESLPGNHKINGYTHSEFKPIQGDVYTLFEKIMQIGTTQHFAVVPGNYLKELSLLAQVCGFDWYHV